MIGITSYGAYIPRLRLNRMSIFRNMGWYSPAIIAVAQGERSMCNWDEDSLTMAVAAARDCLIGKDKGRVDACFLSSTTLPFSDRQNAGILATALNLKEDIMTSDFASSQKAGATALSTAIEMIKGGGKKNILVVASDNREAKPGSFHEMWFGDGAAAVMLGAEDVIAEFRGGYSLSYDFVDHYRGSQAKFDYNWEERWVREEGYSKIIPEAINGLFRKLDISMDQVDKLVYPCYFKTVHREIAKRLGAGQDKLVGNMHELCGETGAAHPLLMLASVLEESSSGDRILVAGFGQGCDVLYFEVTENIKNIAARNGVKGYLQKKKTIDNYLKFLSFRDEMVKEIGMRGEASPQTAMTVLWRKRKMILGLVGGKCRDCGTPQFPKMDICVKPGCNHFHSQDEYEFADIPAFVKTFTGDMLGFSVDPPAIYGMIQFKGGGRFVADFTDCELQDVKVGIPVRMSFRRRFKDNLRGFTLYFWKAVPQADQEI